MTKRRRVYTKNSQKTLSAGRNANNPLSHLADKSKTSETFTLVIFSGGSYGVYRSNNIFSIHENECIVRCSGGRFEAKILASGHDKDHLLEIKQKLDAYPFDNNKICSGMQLKNLLAFVSNCLAADVTKQNSNQDSFQDFLPEIDINLSSMKDVNHNICEQETALNISSKTNEAALLELQTGLTKPSNYMSDRSEIQTDETNYSNPNSIRNITENQNKCTTQPKSHTTLRTEPFFSSGTQPAQTDYINPTEIIQSIDQLQSDLSGNQSHNINETCTSSEISITVGNDNPIWAQFDALAHDSMSELMIPRSEVLILQEYINNSVENGTTTFINTNLTEQVLQTKNYSIENENMNENTKNDSMNTVSTEQIEPIEATVSNEIPNSDDESQSDEGPEYNLEENMNKNTKDDSNAPINSMSIEQMEHLEETTGFNEMIYSDDDVESQSDEGSEYNLEENMNKNTKDNSNNPINSISTEQMEHVNETTLSNEIIYSDDDVKSQSDEGSEYNPEDHYIERDSSNVTDSDDDLDEPEAYAPNKSTSMNGSRNQSTDRSCNLSSTSNVPGTSACDDTGMVVKPSTGPKGAGKLYFCFFCHKKISKIARHLESVHKDEAEVKKFAILPKKTAERAQMIKKLRDKGNFIHNKNADFNQGELIPCRRPQKKMNKNAQHFVPCPKCRGFYAKNNIRHHYKLCAGGSGTNSRSILVAARKMLGRVDAVASLKLRTQIIPVMREDEIVRLIRYDHLLTLYGNKMCRKFKKPHQYNMIRAHLRLLGRFLTDLKKNNPEINDFTSLYDPKFYDAVLSSINNIAEFDEEMEVYGKPSLAAGIGTCIKKMGAILETECIKQHNDEKKNNTADFLKLFNEDFGCSVGKTVTESQIKYKRQKTVDLPETDDISRLNNFLNERREAAYQSLQKNFTYEAWLSLAQATLILIQVFNRRRAGEIERVTIDDFNCRKGADEIDKHSLSSLPIKDQEAARKYVRLTICGKLNRTVPVLLSTVILQSVLTIIQFRNAAKVPDNNPYVFGLPSTTDHKRHIYLRACNLMRKFAEECSATNPKALRGTTLRKHVATKCASMNLPENEICDVANFMGHHENIHKNIYRQPVINRDIIRMSQVLEQAVGTSNVKPKTKDYEKENVLDEMNSETTRHAALDNADDLDDSLERQNQLLGSINNQEKEHIQSKNKYRNYGTKESTNNELSTDMQVLSSRDSCQNYFNAINSQISDTEDDDQTEGRYKIKKKQHSKKIQIERRRWSQNEVETCFALFETDITKSIIPSLPVIAKKIANHNCLRRRTPVLVKAWINNQIKKREKSECRGENKKRTRKNYC